MLCMARVRALCSIGRTFCWGSGLHGLVSATGGPKEQERVRDLERERESLFVLE